ncbi:MAG: ParA family protein [Gammaproteobacteria bacterium]|nr:ParA family protein [Gammaproteobacteria bacterium]
MTEIIAIANQKGGVGKTTTTINLAAALQQMRSHVLVCDLDPQGNATVGLGVEADDYQHSACELLLQECQFDEAVCSLAADDSKYRFDLVPANNDLTAAEIELTRQSGCETRLRDILRQLPERRYDFVLLDCPPALNLLNLNALTAADKVLIPMQCEYFAMEGLTALLNTIRQIKDSVNPGLKIEGILRTMYDVRNNLSLQVSRQLAEHFGPQLYRTVVPRNVRLAEAPSFGESIISYDADSRGAIAYLGLAGEFLRRRQTTAETAATTAP